MDQENAMNQEKKNYIKAQQEITKHKVEQNKQRKANEVKKEQKQKIFKEKTEIKNYEKEA
jgi:ribosomal protein L44E